MIRSPAPQSMLVAAMVLLGVGKEALGRSTDWIGMPRATVRLITASDTVGTGPTLKAGLEFRYADGWHGYWRTPGDAGIAPVLHWSASKNIAPPVVRWPVPSRLVVAGLQNAVYEGRFVLPLAFTLREPHAASHIAVSVDYAACSNICVPLHADLALDLPAGAGEASTEASLIATGEAAVPGSFRDAGLAVVRRTRETTDAGSSLVLELRSGAAPFVHPDLFVEGAGDGLPPAPVVRLDPDGRSATFGIALPRALPSDAPLAFTFVDGERQAEDAAPLAPASAPAPTGGLIAILGLALLGGLILNLMPCVLPVLSIKLFGLTRHAGHGRRAIRLGFLATALGIVTCFLAIAAALIVLQRSGATLGWGIQFQQPWFLAALAVLTVLFAASFFDWLPIGLPSSFAKLGGGRSRSALVEAYLQGVFSTLLATPCSAPFVGTAVGFALARGPLEILAVFACLGCGMALPFAAVAAVPGALAWLPRPGAWMLRLRQILGLLLLCTAAWLLVVLWSVAGSGAALAVGVLLGALLGLRAWIARHPAGDARWPTMATGGLAASAVAVASLAIWTGSASPATPDGWRRFDPEAIPGLVAGGGTVLVDVTATWCLTCKVNDITTLSTTGVRDRLRQAGTVRMRADWSRPDGAIAAYLRRFGRFGIPLDVVYGPGSPTGNALPELLSANDVVAALDHASSPRP